MIPFRTGNLGVARLLAVRRGEPAPEPRAEIAQLTAWRAAGFDAVEDYVAWAAVEREPGRPDWRAHREHAREAHRLGMAYVIYPWAHAIPDWHRRSHAFEPARCVEHGEPCTAPSLVAASTWTALERFHRAVAAALGDVVDGVVAAFPADYGEVGAPCGMADWLLGEEPGRPRATAPHDHPGLWCDEAPARAEFAEQVRARHRTPARLGEAWALSPDEAWARCPWPGSHATLTHRREFAAFYRGAITRLAARQAALLAGLFPRVPRELKLGHCSEALELGSDWHALVAVAAEAGATVRFTGAGMHELFTRRLSSLCRSHGAPFATEAPREIDGRHLRERLFTDLASGTQGFFEFPEQLAAVAPRLPGLRAAFGRTPVAPRLACVYATADLALAPGRGAPAALLHAWPVLRRAADLALLDEGQIEHGALRGVDGLLLLDGEHVPRRALRALHDWVRAGGVLISALPAAPAPLGDLDEGGTRPEAADDDALREFLAWLSPLPELRLHLPAGHGTRADAASGERSSPHVLLPGEHEARVFLGPGWHGREDGAWAFPAHGTQAHGESIHGAGVPCRWTGAEAHCLLPQPPGADLDLVLEVFVPPRAPDAPLRVLLDGELHAEVRGRGRQFVRVPLPAPLVRAPGDLRRLTLAADTHRPHAHGDSTDQRDLGVLVRAAALLPGEALLEAAHGVGALTEVQAGLRCTPHVADGSVQRCGAGWILRGDGTPLSALAWLNTWLAGSLADIVAGTRAASPPDPPRDAFQQCLVTALDGGLLVHDPDAARSATPRLVGAGTERLAGPTGPPPARALAPLETRWLPFSAARPE